MKVTLSSFIVAIGLSSMTIASPLHRAVRRQEDGHSSSTAPESVYHFGIWPHNHTRPHKPTGSHTGSPTTDTGILTVQTQTSLTQTGPTLVNRDDATTSPSPTTVSDFRPRKFTGFDTHKFTGIPPPSVTWTPQSGSHTRSAHTRPIYSGTYRHIPPPPKPTGPIACALGESDSDDVLFFAKKKHKEATKHASQSHLNRREESEGPWVGETIVIQSTSQPPKPPTTTSSHPPPPPPPPPPPSSSTTTAPTATLTSKAITPPTIESKTPVCPSAGTAGTNNNNIWCLGGQTFYLECDTDHHGDDFGSVNLVPQNWDM
ncbi:hypothetical protein B0H65DRAFT_551678 [Neurospora tetraspora]|uniref:Uncharacterized protein n=1 Tax=Neurospora tetraspora TaxID=94610 RepID=A0AAE0J8D9_9PEZI|nr:hypothetical protein B0H65DRAFT_551678 [Neurospora tetraspora]